MHQLLAMLVLVLLPQQQPTLWTYEEAYAQAMAENRPLLVVVTEKGCGPCELLKRDTILPMHRDNELTNAVLVIVNKDERPELASQLMRGEKVPQTILFRQQPVGWLRLTLIGNCSRKAISKLLNRAR